MSGNVVLITGGTSGIGLAWARAFLAAENTVIVTGRDPAKLARAQVELPGVRTVQSDAADPAAIAALAARVTKDFPDLNVLINNAGIMRKINLHDENVDLRDLTREIETNLMGPVRLISSLLPQLKSRPAAAIVNVSSVLAVVPLAISPVYSATKAGLHSYTQALRVQLKKTNVRVFELMPPGVDTPLLRDEFSPEDLGGVKGMPALDLVRAAMAGLARDQFEIRPGLSRAVGWLSRIAPGFAVKRMGQSAEAMIRDGGRAR